LRRGPERLLAGVDLTLHAGWRVGVVGRNGSGKSSLFAAIRGELEADHGQISLSSKVRIASVAQETPALSMPALDFVISGDAALWTSLRDEREATRSGDFEAAARAHERLGELQGYDAEARAGRLLHGLGFTAATHRQEVRTFSGGWRVRLNLARALMTPSELLLLDEPTNHLDLDAVLWLEQWLLRYPGTLLVISHDREFLDGVCTHVVHLHDRRARLYAGNYSSFERQRAEQLRQQQLNFDKEQAERERLQRFVDRFRAKATKASQAQSRLKRLEKLAGTEAIRAERSLDIEFPAPAKLPFSLVTLDGVSAGYRSGEHEAQVLGDVRFSLEAGDRVAFLGPNGAGKSTLVKTLVGELAPLQGARRAHEDLVAGYFAQHTVESLRAGESPYQHLQVLAPDAAPQALRDFLGRWFFSSDRAFEPVDNFSGGERARLALALIAWQRPNVLLLDEPTNHLDLDMREALAEALADYEGAIVLVSHDRHLLGLVCESFWRVADGRVARFDGDLDDYAGWLRSRGARDDERPGAPSDRQQARLETRARSRELARQRKKLDQLEARLEALYESRKSLESRLSDPACYAGDTDALARLSNEHREISQQIESVERDWLELSDALETQGGGNGTG
jgi:ATP-binding cassette subfamily F protein 3